MSDDRSPSASSDGSEPERAERPRYGEYAPPGWTPPEPPQAWTAPAAPPKPGLIPLRPLLLADVIAAAFQVIRRNPGPTFWLSLGIAFVTSLLAVGLVGLVAWGAVSGIDPAASPDLDAVRGVVTAVALAALVAVVLQVVLMAIPQAVVVTEVARAALGERHPLGELWRRARGRVAALIGWMLILGGGAGLVTIAILLGLVELGLTGGVGGAITAAGLGVLAVLAIIAVAFWLGTKLAFVPALIVIERLPLGAALRRSWAMTEGSFWRILGITLLVNLIVQAGAQIVTMPIAFLSGVVEQAQPAGTLDARAIVVLIVSLLLQVVITAIAVVVQAAVPTLLYLDVRMRREGFDAVLQADARERAAGRTPASDPFG